jgi:hypothetical protein
VARGTIGTGVAVDGGFCGTENIDFASGHINVSIDAAAAAGRGTARANGRPSDVCSAASTANAFVRFTETRNMMPMAHHIPMVPSIG